jgi:hypothetical protein
LVATGLTGDQQNGRGLHRGAASLGGSAELWKRIPRTHFSNARIPCGLELPVP